MTRTDSHSNDDPGVSSPNVAVQLEDPRSVEAAGQRVAEVLSDRSVTTILVGEDVRDLLLGHVVARELDARLVYAFDDSGLVSASGVIERDARVAFIGTAIAATPPVRTVIALLERTGAELRAVVTLEGTFRSDVPMDPGRLIALNSPSGT